SPPQGTLTSMDDLLDLAWHVPVRSVFSRVEVEHDVPHVRRSLIPSFTVSSSRGESMTDGHESVQFFEPPASQDWHGLQTPAWLGDAGSVDNYLLKRGAGSFRGGVILSGDDDNVGRL